MSELEVQMAQLRQNRNQWAAFQESGHCVVLAPPGSGKTKLLTTKVAHQVLSGEVRAPRSVACITMTNEAANEIVHRLRRLGLTPSGNFFVGTVHSFAINRVLKPYGALVADFPIGAQRLASRQEEDDCMAGVLSSVHPREHYLIKSTIEVARKRLDLTGNPLLGGRKIAQLALAYERSLASRGLFDFIGAIRAAVEVLEENSQVRALVGATTSHLYVDEYQDLAPGLDRIVRALTLREESVTRLFGVGDPDQSIYGFSGAHPSLLNELAADGRVSTVRLQQNYRSGGQVIASALLALGEHRDIRSDVPGGDVRLHGPLADASLQAERVLELVVAAIEEGVALEEVAVLSSWRQDQRAFADLAREAGLPVYTKRDDEWRATPLTLSIELACSWISRRSSEVLSLAPVLTSFQTALRSKGRRVRHEYLKSLIDILYSGRPEHDASSFVERILEAVTVTGSHLREDEERELQNMRRALLPNVTGAGPSVEDLALRARAPGFVMNATIHGAKGLEFDRVVISGVDSGCLVGFSVTPETVAEGRRKLYVAITRARQRVDMVYCSTRISSKGNQYPVSFPSFARGLATS